ncbi:unnamed protein product [Phyllotreta striolata]|uniref:DNA primase large subunit n=1 Tax=Phyllotreta striolata TaxID=444603 RepID=A0A9N9XRD6_PHYSR|nr:unnamed protein product [Phyllotreta striolata]
MDTSVGRRKVHRNIYYTDAGSEYQHDVSMYKVPPSNSIYLEEFEELAVERLQLLRILEESSAKGHRVYSEDWKSYIKEELAKEGLKKFLRLASGYCSQTELDFQARKADYISHYILRVAYCRSETLRRWFVNRELEWFKLKFLAQSHQGFMKFLQLNDFTYTPIRPEVKEKLNHDLYTSTAIPDREFNTTDFFKVPFTEVLPLVKGRKVFLKQGYAYIPTSDLIVCILSQFRASLNESLLKFNSYLPRLDDDRIGNLLENLHYIHTGDVSYEDTQDALNPANLDSYAKQFFPLCMSTLFNVLKTQHHLKHFGRLSLLLFLKGIGLSLENTMELWRNEFTKNPKIDSNTFEKQYAYLVRHSFGQAGARVSYSPHSCLKIIMSNVGQGEYHGCPFKTWDPVYLKQKLTELGLGSQAVTSIVESASGGHYQVACTKCFEGNYGQAPASSINHPNQYFSEAVKLVKEKQEKKH